MSGYSQRYAPDVELVEIEKLHGEWWCKHAGAVCTLSLIWMACFRQLAIEWNHNPEYRHGWLMPAAVVLLLFVRYRQFPFEPSANRAVLPSRIVLLAIVAFVAWFPVRVIGQANPDWHLMAWVTFGIALAMSAVVCHALGGKEAVRHYIAPFMIIAGAIPLPFVIEQNLITFLKATTAASTLEILHFAEIAAFRETRDIIVLKEVVLGIEDGCTGIRSLHLCLAAGLFWGELNQLALAKRVLLVVFSAVFAVFVNVSRSIVLAFVAEKGGAAAFEHYHEIAGTIAQFIALGAGGLVLMWLVRKAGGRKLRRTSGRTILPALSSGSTVRLPGWIFCCCAFSVAFAEAGRVAWFELRTPPLLRPAWDFREPAGMEEYQRVSLPKNWSRKINADTEFSAEWTGKAGRMRALHFMRWSQSNPAAFTAAGHRPEICLSGAGFEMVTEPVTRRFTVGDLDLNFERFQFSRQGRGVVIYFAVWDAENNLMSIARDAQSLRLDRLRRAWKGVNSSGRRLMEVGFWATEADETEAEMQAVLDAMIVPKG